MALTQITLSGTYKNPDGTVAQGWVEFTLVQTMLDGADNLMVTANPIVAQLNYLGIISVTLYANDDSTTVPIATFYQVTEHIGLELYSYDIVLSTANGTTQNIADLNHLNAGGASFSSGTLDDEVFVRSQRLDQMTSPANNINMAGHGLINVLNGSAATDGANMGNLLSPWVSTGTVTQTVAGNGTAGTQCTISDPTGLGAAFYYRKGMKFSWSESGTTKYGVIASSTNSSGTTTITLVATNSYSMATGLWGASITAGVPVDFPTYFGWNPQFNTGSVVPGSGWWNIVAGVCRFGFIATGNVNASATTFTCVPPLPPNGSANFKEVVSGVSNGVAVSVGVGSAFGGIFFTLEPAAVGGGLTWPTGNRQVSFTSLFPI